MKKKLSAIALILLLIMILCEGAGYFLLHRIEPHYWKARLVLQGYARVLSRAEQLNCIGQAYLLYIPAPGALDHNQHGYRGPKVPLAKQPGVARILFLGGSTTYGFTIPQAKDSYPLQVKQILQRQLPPGVNGIEVINAGLNWGTTAELLTHYHFKYSYYQPDLVVINTGANDSVPATLAYYHPDYSHWRHPLLNLKKLPGHSRWLLHSRFLSFCIIHFFYYDIVHARHLTQGDRSFQPTAPWFPQVTRDKQGLIPERHSAFYQNLQTLIQEIRSHGAKVLLVPVRCNPNSALYLRPQYQTPYFQKALAESKNNEIHLQRLARKYKLALAPFPANIISPDNWCDHCHVNAAGANEKARHIAAYIRKILWP